MCFFSVLFCRSSKPKPSTGTSNDHPRPYEHKRDPRLKNARIVEPLTEQQAEFGLE
ncbi:49d8d6d3-f96b-40b0-8587-27d44f744549 [Thermothielavioides terrestris]|uniref:49d8d6d3-f96b-40b0-8587-27d44f744549 n=1 Tax=Thermothielavioides terrestris TaxID=2587410 RepID=A0A446BLA9_9PEZI|nr:49d8d6d3-f96b-40b0-8587-27d44f744549 [Thermothielavioides terrestris]